MITIAPQPCGECKHDLLWHNGMEGICQQCRCLGWISAMQVIEKLQARIADYENCITWDVTCSGCAGHLDNAIAEHERADGLQALLDHAVRRAEELAGQRDEWRRICDRALTKAMYGDAVPEITWLRIERDMRMQSSRESGRCMACGGEGPLDEEHRRCPDCMQLLRCRGGECACN